MCSDICDSIKGSSFVNQSRSLSCENDGVHDHCSESLKIQNSDRVKSSLIVLADKLVSDRGVSLLVKINSIISCDHNKELFSLIPNMK